MSLESGSRLGRFEIRGRLDLPGFEEVYAAHDPDRQRDVAIHVLRTSAARDEEVREQFERGVRAAAAHVQSQPLTIHLVGIDAQAVYVVSDPVGPAFSAGPAPSLPPLASPPEPPHIRDVRSPRLGWTLAAIVVVVALGSWIFVAGNDNSERPSEQAVAEPEGIHIPASPPVAERKPPLPEPTEAGDDLASDSGAARTRSDDASGPSTPLPPPPRETAPPPATAPRASVAPPIAPRAEPAAGPRSAAPGSSPAGPASPAWPAVAPRSPAPSTDTRDARTLVTEATVRATQFDLEGALELLELASSRGDASARVAMLYVRGLIVAREAFREGGSGGALKPVEESMRALDEIAKGRPGAAEIAKLMLHAAAAAAQSERDEMRLYVESATQMEALQHAAGQSGAPMVSAAELAGDLWLQVHRYEDARRAYTTAAEHMGSTLRVLSGLARVARRLNDMPAACTSYRRLVDVWGARPGLPVEIAEARAYLGGCR